uniref:Protein kinase domain-containing protein n=1 Tax=Panagrolaimus sp. ES5 TaxID=591445 RepID=A0AC34GCB7_9BILA
MLLENENDHQQSDGEKDEGRDSMFREAQIMAKCKHKHVTNFYGVQCDTPPIMIVMEYCNGGSLDIHLQKQKENISDGERTVYCYEAARGMRYLHFHKFIHRDLAARNCLISENGNIKISDFGLTCSTIDQGNGGNTSIKNIPLRWMAPETLCRTPNFSPKSDIWAYGILAYEIYNLGIKPWAEEENQKKICHIIKHGPMPDLPERTPAQMKDLIHHCWTQLPSERPEFRDIVNSIVRIVQNNPQMKFPKPNEFSVNRLLGVHRNEESDIDAYLEEALSIYPAEI